jgi:pyridoxine 5'-phosphate synthase PdxJ
MIVDLEQLTPEQRKGLAYEAGRLEVTEQEAADSIITRHANDFYRHVREMEIQSMREAGEQLMNVPEEMRALLLSIPALSEEKLKRIVEIVKE